MACPPSMRGSREKNSPSMLYPGLSSLAQHLTLWKVESAGHWKQAAPPVQCLWYKPGLLVNSFKHGK